MILYALYGKIIYGLQVWMPFLSSSLKSLS